LRLKNTNKEYGLIARGFHWGSALIVLAMLSLGLYMAGLDVSPFKFQLYFWHKSFGLLILGLVFLRLVWRLTNDPPEPLKSHEKWEKNLSRLIHGLLYFGLVLMPLSGWFMSSAGDFPVSFFGLFEMPDIVPKNETLFKILLQIHTLAAYALIGGLVLHLSGAAKHHLIDKDKTLTRMGGRTWIIPVAVLLLALPIVIEATGEDEDEDAQTPAISSASSAGDQGKNVFVQEQSPAESVQGVSQWIIDPSQSHIKFKATQYGEAFEGEFKNFDGTIYFDTDNLAKSQVDIEIDIASIVTGSDGRDGQAKETDWFDAGSYPKAYFQAKNIVRADSNRYIAKGYLTIKGATIPAELPFTLTFEDGKDGTKFVYMGGGITLSRLDFGIGQGQWEDAETIGNEVKIMISVFAAREP